MTKKTIFLTTLLILFCWLSSPAQEVFKNAAAVVTKVHEGMWVIEKADDHTTMYLIEGADKAMLVDAGNPIEKFDSIVKLITRKPILMMLTHGHGDHTGNIRYFDQIYLHPADTALLANRGYKGKVNFLKDGDVFDLGGKLIQVRHMPGHTMGSVVFLDKKTGDCFSGDTFGSGQVWLWITPVATMQNYLSSCQKMKVIMDLEGITKFFVGHSGQTNVFEKEYLTNMLSLAQSLINGTPSIPPQKATIGAKNHLRATLGNATIVYDPEQINNEKHPTKFLGQSNMAGLRTDSSLTQNQELQTFATYKDIGYDQALRPQFHFSSLKNWHNDPNGMVWYEGEYHLFFQHNPKDIKWGNMTWGHAVSTDMIHWKQLPHAILPYGGGTIFSGTAVVDQNNVLGKQIGNVKTIVAIFSFAKAPFYQAAAYSTDKGRTFQLLNNGGPVVPNQGFDKGERDPKVFWHKASKKWVMVLWVKRGAKEGTPEEKLGKVRFFTSDNLTNWTVASDFDRAWVFECMDFVELPVDGVKENKKWLLYDAGFHYEIGDFDGKTFTTEKKVFKGDVGTNFYAAQTFNNSPDDRTVIIGWMNQGKNSVFEKAGMPFNQQMSFPTTMELRTTSEGIRLYRWPVKEIEKLYTTSYRFKNLSVEKLEKKLVDVNAELIDLTVEFEPKNSFKLVIRGLEIAYDLKSGIFAFETSRVAAPVNAGKVKLRVLLDRASIELFANEGAVVATCYAVAEANNQSISISADPDTKINSLIINKLKSSW